MPYEITATHPRAGEPVVVPSLTEAGRRPALDAIVATMGTDVDCYAVRTALRALGPEGGTIPIPGGRIDVKTITDADRRTPVREEDC